MLLSRGAGIHARRDLSLWIDKRSNVLTAKAWPSAWRLVQDLATKIASNPDLDCDYLVAFENRPATVQLAQMLAIEISKHRKHPVGVLAVKRQGADVYLAYYQAGSELAKQGTVIYLDRRRLRASQEMLSLLINRRVLLFTDALLGEDHEGSVHTLLAINAVWESRVKVLGLAALVIQRGGVRHLLNRIAPKRRLRVEFLLHMRDVARPKQQVDEQSQSAIARIWLNLFDRSVADRSVAAT